ncbi:MAG: potassium-transporting ATPase subunit C [Nitrososphaerota archaeon]|nr:potassium-transporting ATPase subunit C [Nitrososphaerota archaeon]
MGRQRENAHSTSAASVWVAWKNSIIESRGASPKGMRYQANGQIAYLNGHKVGSILIAQGFTSSLFFPPRNNSASGVDPDITLQGAYSQIPRIVNATGMPVTSLESILQQNSQRTLWIFGTQYVNVLKVNLILMETYPSIYQAYRT